MDIQTSSHPEAARMEQIVSQFFLKSLHIILDSRIPFVHQHDHSSGELPWVSRVRRSDKWFNLMLGDRPGALDNLNFWCRNLADPLIVDIIVVDKSSVETVIERWSVQHEPSRLNVAEYSSFYKKTYKRAIVLLRSLYSTMRLLPAHKIFQQLSSSTQTYDFDIIYKISSFSDPFSREEDELMKQYCFSPVEAFPGCISVTVTYRSNLSDFNLTPLTTLPPLIITDYVGSPATEPSRAFPSPEMGWRATSFSPRGIQPPSSPLHRPHSWTSGIHRGATLGHTQSLGSSPSFMPFGSPSPPPDTFLPKLHNFRPPSYLNATALDEYHLSPPFSHSPSSPSYLLDGSLAPTHLRSGTAPVSIPFPVISKSPKHLSPNCSDPNKHYLPPFSPKSMRHHDPSSQSCSSGNRSFRKSAESLKAGESPSGATTTYSSGKVLRDSKDDSGRFSGLLSSSSSPRIGFSRSSSKLSFQDDLDDGDFSCPFVVDDVDTVGLQSSQNQSGRSQDNAVGAGALVQLLRAAPPLRNNDPCYSVQSSSAMEDLRGFREMKEMLLSKSGLH